MDVKHLTFLSPLHPRLRFSVCAWTWRKSMSTIQRIKGQIHPAASLPLLRIRNVVLSPAMLPRTALFAYPHACQDQWKKWHVCVPGYVSVPGLCYGSRYPIFRASLILIFYPSLYLQTMIHWDAMINLKWISFFPKIAWINYFMLDFTSLPISTFLTGIVLIFHILCLDRNIFDTVLSLWRLAVQKNIIVLILQRVGEI